MTGRNKNIALIVGFVLLLILVYKLSIVKTVEQKKRYENLKTQETLFENAPRQISMLKQKEKYFDSLFHTYQLNGQSIQNNLLRTITTQAKEKQLKVIDFVEPHKFNFNGLTTNTYELSLQGSFNSILELLYELEQHTKFGEIISLKFEKKKNYKKARYYLTAKIILKSIG